MAVFTKTIQTANNMEDKTGKGKKKLEKFCDSKENLKLFISSKVTRTQNFPVLQQKFKDTSYI